MAAQRYETITKKTDIYYSSNCPIVLSAYAVLFDTKKNKNMAQLKFRNCSSEKINSVSVTVRTYDHFEKLSEEVNDCQYVDVNAVYGNEFGTKNLISLSKDIKVNKLEVAVNRILFSDGSTWDSEVGELLNNKLEINDLSSVFSYEDIKNYRFLLNPQMKYVPYLKDKIWLCSCGAVNYGSDTCNNCGAEKSKVLDNIDKDNLYRALLDPKYNSGIELKNQHSVESLEKAAIIFEELGNYKDSKELSTACRKEVEQLRKIIEEKKQEEEKQAEARRLEAEKQAEVRRLEAEQKAKRNRKIVVLCAAVLVACIAVFFVVSNIIIPNNNYNAAVKLMEVGDYDAAIEAFEAMDGYKDTASLIEECKKAKVYQNAVELMNDGKYEEAIEQFKTIDGYKDSTAQSNKCEIAIQQGIYDNAIELFNAEKYEEAQVLFESLGDFSDSTEKTALCKEKNTEKTYKAATDAIEQGNYRAAVDLLTTISDYKNASDLIEDSKKKFIYDSDVKDLLEFGEFKGESISWRVLKKDNGCLTLITEKAIDAQPYNETRVETSWERCSLRRWLNDDWANEAFSDNEWSFLTSDDSPVSDYVYILNQEEAERYFESDNDRMCECTDYATQRGLGPTFAKQYSGYTTWWLRDVVINGKQASTIDLDGSIHGSGDWVDAGTEGSHRGKVGVRPVICVRYD